MHRLIAAAVLLAAVAFTDLAAARVPEEPLASYSNMCFSPRSGDLRGERMILYRTGHKDLGDKEQIWVLYQRSEGVLSAPLFERAAIDGDNIRLELHFPSPPNLVRTLVGRITPEAIAGRYTDPNGSRAVLLKRDARTENRFPDCSDRSDSYGERWP